MKNTKSASQITLTLVLGTGLAAGLAWYYDVFVHWQPRVYPFVLAALFAGVLALTLLALWVRGERNVLSICRLLVKDKSGQDIHDCGRRYIISRDATVWCSYQGRASLSDVVSVVYKTIHSLMDYA